MVTASLILASGAYARASSVHGEVQVNLSDIADGVKADRGATVEIGSFVMR